MGENDIILIGKEVSEDVSEGVPVCGGNLSSPVIDKVHYMEEIHYKIGNREYIENAD
jgi:hypothetical protein